MEPEHVIRFRAVGFDVAGKRVLVTGASSGIGAALAEAFAAAGATVGICARRADRLAEVHARCAALAPGSRQWVVDLADPAQVDRLAADAVAELGAVDVLVNNAGIPFRHHVTALTPADVERVMAINFLSPVRLTQALLPHLLSRPEARIVNVSSIAATLSSPGEAAYDASKAALTAFTEAMAIDLWDTPVDVLLVYPGLIATELVDAPGNDPVPAGVEAIDVAEVPPAVLGALAAGAVECYVPAWFADIVKGKAGNVAGFLAGSAEFVRTRRIPEVPGS
jgi:NAD(P)-dependent dehydrogenase (short-subunit alcohol dehydrogenase family)